MTVAELVFLLQGFEDQTMVVLLASDDEWNRIRPMYAADHSAYVHEVWGVNNNRVSYEAVHPDDFEEYEPEDIKYGVVLW